MLASHINNVSLPLPPSLSKINENMFFLKERKTHTQCSSQSWESGPLSETSTSALSSAAGQARGRWGKGPQVTIPMKPF